MFFINKGKKQAYSSSISEIAQELDKIQNNSKYTPSIEEVKLIENLKIQTQQLNTNNVTRTRAYLEFYQQFPEVHWAFLAHMVSRNGGWNMTDLKGDLISSLLSMQSKQDFFSFLERANFLIFLDAYPQLLLYKESLARQQNLFHLLPFLNISVFMIPIWNYFWVNRNNYILTVGLIINEQCNIENKLMRKNYFKENVLNTIEFKLQEILSFNHILFPYLEKGSLKLMGKTVYQFESLERRILLGKELYSLLFYEKDRLKDTEEWARLHVHTASRKDYWPQVFNDIKEYAPGTLYVRRINKCKLRKGVPRIYSPKLEFAWKNVEHKEETEIDWYSEWKLVDMLKGEHQNIVGEIKSDYCLTLEKLELALIAKKAFFL